MAANSLKSRLEALERIHHAPELLTIIINIVGIEDSGPLIGYENGNYGCERQRIMRRPKETDEELLERAKASVTPSPNAIVLCTIYANY